MGVIHALVLLASRKHDAAPRANRHCRREFLFVHHYAGAVPSTPARPTPPGTWPLLISGALFLLLVPAYFLGQVVPSWLALVGAVLFLAAAVGALAWSWSVYVSVRSKPARGVPIAGIVVGIIPAVLAALLLLPAAIR